MKKNLTRILSLLLVLVLMVGVLPVSALADGWDLTGELDTEQLLERAEPVEMQASASDFSKILHLDCGRKYFTKDWIIALLYEMQAAGYNQLQLAFGNDGLRFLLNDMSFTANGKSYSHDTVVSKVEAGNIVQNSSNDPSWLTEAEMDAIIAKATELGIEIVPLLNLPGHANALLDIADDTYNATGSNNTLNVVSTDDSARNFGMAIFKKYVDYFHSKGCNYFNFGADEYANDASGLFSFSRLTEQEYARFASFINSLAAYIVSNGMTPRAFNDGLYYNKSNPWDMNTSKNTSIKSIQCCYWSSGWDAYPVATASQIASKSHSMINTHGDFYYVLGKSDKFDSGYSYASGFYNTTFAGGTTITNPVGSMFCIWCDYPNAETETVVAQKTRLVLRAMAARMDNKSIDTISKAVVANGFNEDGTLNYAGTEFEIIGEGGSTPTLEVGKTLTLRIANGVSADWMASPEGIVELTAPVATRSAAVTANSVNVTPLKAGDVTITATNPENESQKATFALTVSDPDAPVTETVTLTVGQEVTRTQDGDLHGTYTPNPAGVASVNVTAEPVAGEITYAPVTSLTAGTFYVSTEANDKTPTVTLTLEDAGNGQYYLKDSSGQYIYPNASWSFGWSYSRGTGKEAVSVVVNNGGIAFKKHHTYNGFFSNYETDAYLKLSGSTFGATGSITSLYLYTKETQPAGWKSTITFKGLAVGNTTVKIGNVTYNITVTEQNLETVTPLSVEYWITNRPLKVRDDLKSETRTNKQDNKTYTAYWLEIPATTDGINSNDGLPVSAFAPSPATNLVDSESPNYVFWAARALVKAKTNESGSKTEEQTTDGGDDETLSGILFTHIRYLGGTWSVYDSENKKWEPIDSTYQLVAYYMQRTTVTAEVITDVVDWGVPPEKLTWNVTYFSVLDFAVKYENGEQVPTSFANDKTITYAMDTDGSSRTIGLIQAQATDDYEVYMITVTPNSDSSTTYVASSVTNVTNGGYSYDGTEKVVWVDNEANLGEFVDESTHYTGYHVGGEATVPSLTLTNRHGLLVTYYVRAKKTETSLTVHYVDRDSNTEFYTYEIAVYDALFNENIGLGNPWKGPLANGTVINSLGRTQTVSADLSTLPQLSASYGYSDYECIEVTRSDDRKEVTLYYTFKNTTNFIIDFGTKVAITAADMGYDNTNWEASSISGAKYGTAELDKTNHILYYTPTKPLTETESLQLRVGKKNVQGVMEWNTRNVNILPASNVLYEENFLTTVSDDWTRDSSTTPTAAQQTQKLDSSDTTTYNVFGFDAAYSDKRGETGVWKADKLDSSKLTKPLTTSFYGNGFDLIGNCGPNTGRVLMIISPADGSKRGARVIDVDTRYNGDSLYQVPLTHVEFDNDAAYNVKIWASGLDKTTAGTSRIATASLMDTYSAADDALLQSLVQSYGLSMSDVEHVTMSNVIPASGAADVSLYGMPSAAALTAEPQANVEHQQGTHVEIDSFRVYRTTDKNDDIAGKYPVAEQGIVYNNILDVVKGQIVAFTEDNPEKEVVITDYEAAGGPQNEIYIGKGRAITFNVEGATEIQVSLRAVTNTAAQWATSADGEDVSTISTNTEMYYTITKDSSGNFVIANRGDALLAIGNVKLPSGAKTMSASEIGEDALRASVCAALGLSAEQPQAFQPKTFTARATTLPMLRNKRVSVLITISNDVSYVTVNGVKYTPSRYYASWQKTRLIQFGETLGKYESKTYTIIAYDANGVASAPITVNG